MDLLPQVGAEDLDEGDLERGDLAVHEDARQVQLHLCTKQKKKKKWFNKTTADNQAPKKVESCSNTQQKGDSGVTAAGITKSTQEQRDGRRTKCCICRAVVVPATTQVEEEHIGGDVMSAFGTKSPPPAGRTQKACGVYILEKSLQYSKK